MIFYITINKLKYLINKFKEFFFCIFLFNIFVMKKPVFNLFGSTWFKIELNCLFALKHPFISKRTNGNVLFCNFFKKYKNFKCWVELINNFLVYTLNSNCSWADLFTCGDFKMVINFFIFCLGKYFITKLKLLFSNLERNVKNSFNVSLLFWWYLYKKKHKN